MFFTLYIIIRNMMENKVHLASQLSVEFYDTVLVQISEGNIIIFTSLTLHLFKTLVTS